MKLNKLIGWAMTQKEWGDCLYDGEIPDNKDLLKEFQENRIVLIKAIAKQARMYHAMKDMHANIGKLLKKVKPGEYIQ